LEVGVVGEDSSEPAVKLAIKGKADDGWYPVSEIEIRNPKHEIHQGTPGGANSKP